MKKLFKHYTADEKLEIVDEYLNGISVALIIKNHNITNLMLEKIIEEHYANLKNCALVEDENVLLQELAKLKKIERDLLKTISGSPNTVNNYLKIQEKIEDIKIRIKNINENNDTFTNKKTMEAELLKMKLDIQRGNYIKKEDATQSVDNIIMIINSAMREMFQKKSKCNCLNILKNTLDEIRTDDDDDDIDIIDPENENN